MIPTLGLSSRPTILRAREQSRLAALATDSRSVDVKDGVHDLSEWMFALSFLWINDFFDNLPLFISEVS